MHCATTVCNWSYSYALGQTTANRVHITLTVTCIRYYHSSQKRCTLGLHTNTHYTAASREAVASTLLIDTAQDDGLVDLWGDQQLERWPSAGL